MRVNKFNLRAKAINHLKVVTIIASVAVTFNSAWGQEQCQDALVKSTYTSQSQASDDWRLAKLVSQSSYDEIKRGGGVNVVIYGVPVGASYDDFKKRVDQLYSSSNEARSHSELLNIAWTRLDPNSPSAYKACLDSNVFLQDGLHAAVQTATKTDISILVRWRVPGQSKTAIVKWQPNAIEGTSIDAKVDDGLTTIRVPRPKAQLALSGNFGGYTTGAIILDPLPPPPPSFKEVKLTKDLLIPGSAVNLYGEQACKKWDVSGIWCIKGLTFDRPLWKNDGSTGVVMDGVNAPYNRFGVGIHPALGKVAQASFNIPEGAKWFRGFIGFAEDEKKSCGVCNKPGGYVTVIISLDEQEVRRFDLRGKSGPPQDFESFPLNVRGSKILNFQVDANEDNYCDSVFIAGPRFTP